MLWIAQSVKKENPWLKWMICINLELIFFNLCLNDIKEAQWVHQSLNFNKLDSTTEALKKPETKYWIF